MNINFTGKLIVDKSFYSLKQSNCDEIVSLTKKVLDTPAIQEIIPEDITLLGKGSKRGDMVTIKYGDFPIEIVTKGKVNSASVPHQILLYTCFKYNKKPRNALFKNVFEKIVEIVKENRAKNI